MALAARENRNLSVPSRLYLTSVPVTAVAHLNPRTPDSVPTLRVTTSVPGVIPTDLSVLASSVSIDLIRLTLMSVNGTAEAVTIIGTEDPPREQVTADGTFTVA